MLKNKSYLHCAVAIFLAAEAILGVLVHTVDGEAVEWVSYSVVLLACSFNLVFFDKSAEFFLTQLALVCTICADWFLLMEPSEKYIYGMLFFNVTQLAYAVRIHLEAVGRKIRTVHIVLRSAAMLAALILPFIVLGDGVDALSVVSVVYFANLLLNTAFAFLNFRSNPIFPIALLLFVGCDIFVGFANLGGYLPIERGTLWYFLAHPGINAAWVFYTPSQALLAVSLLPRKLKKAADSV